MKRALLVIIVICSCGARAAPQVPRLDGRIVGGEDVEIEEFPYQAALQYYIYYICGASIISPNYVLTGAHCTDGMPASVFKVRAGTSFVATGGQLVDVAEVTQHPQYDPNTLDYDVAVLRLASALSTSATSLPITMASNGQEISAGSKAIVSGWGRLVENGTLPSQMQAATVTVFSNSQCKEWYGESSITDQMFCAGEIGGGKDSCQGDSGGPLVAEGAQVGIVSWGYGCGRPNYPGVYAKISQLRVFIKKVSGV